MLECPRTIFDLFLFLPILFTIYTHSFGDCIQGNGFKNQLHANSQIYISIQDVFSQIPDCYIQIQLLQFYLDI